MRFKNKSTVVDATQWFKNGDHPQDYCKTFTDSNGKPFQGEGNIVRYFRSPSIASNIVCPKCKQIMHNHGWIDEPDNKFTVCPGDWVITSWFGDHYSLSPEQFNREFEPA